MVDMCGSSFPVKSLRKGCQFSHLNITLIQTKYLPSLVTCRHGPTEHLPHIRQGPAGLHFWGLLFTLFTVTFAKNWKDALRLQTAHPHRARVDREPRQGSSFFPWHVAAACVLPCISNVLTFPCAHQTVSPWGQDYMVFIFCALIPSITHGTWTALNSTLLNGWDEWMWHDHHLPPDHLYHTHSHTIINREWENGDRRETSFSIQYRQKYIRNYPTRCFVQKATGWVLLHKC